MLPNDRTTRRDTTVLALLAAICAPVVAAYGMMLHYAVNVPIIDDYPNVLGFGLAWERLPTTWAKVIYCVTAQHDEYKFVLMHAIVASELALTHHANMIVLSLCGDLMLLGLLALLWQSWFADEADLIRRLLLFLPISLLFFRMNYAEGVDWVSSSLDYVPAMLFSFWSLHLLCKDACKRFGVAAILALLAYLAAPNAVVLVPLGLLVLLPRRAYGRAAVWCAVFGLGIAPYLYRYSGHGSAEKTTAKPLLLFFLSFLGCGSPLGSAQIAVGIGILLVFGWAWRVGFYRTNPAAMLAAAWLIGSAALVAMGRSHSGLAYSQASRYKIFGDQLLIFGYGVGAERARRMGWMSQRGRRSVYGGVLAAALVTCLRSDQKGARELATRRATLREGLRQFEASPGAASPMYFPQAGIQQAFTRQEAEARVLTIEAIQKGMYVPPHVR